MLCGLLAGLTAGLDSEHAPAPRTEPVLRSVQHVSFCQTGPTHDTHACDWQEVSLPHRWRPAHGDKGWAVYRFRLNAPPGDRLAVLAQRLSLAGEMRPGEAARVLAGNPSGTFLRYWPLVFPFSVPPGDHAGSVEISLFVTGHAAMKNGLGSLDWADVDEVLRSQAQIWFRQVTVLLALAAATIVVGILGFIPGRSRSHAGVMMCCIAGLALASGTRIAMNFVTTPPVGWHIWSTLNHGMLLAISFLKVSILAIYVFDETRRVIWPSVATWALLTGTAFLVPSPWIHTVADAGFLLTTSAGVVLLVLLVRKVWTKPEFIGLALIAIYAAVVALAVHDLSLHLGSRSISSQYLLVWSMPCLLIILSALMMRHLEQQQSLERALQRETEKREDLIRDLHDGLGSRLVALAFHAGRRDGKGSLVGEVDAILRELQLIQRAATAGPTTLGSLLADVRYLYGQIGGGHLPLHWHVDETCADFQVDAQQAVATVRILDEAVANAIKHANPRRIVIRLICGPPPLAARVVIANDGAGHFDTRSSGGLRNMQSRAQRAGLIVDLSERDGMKEVTIAYPAAEIATGPGIARWFHT